MNFPFHTHKPPVPLWNRPLPSLPSALGDPVGLATEPWIYGIMESPKAPLFHRDNHDWWWSMDWSWKIGSLLIMIDDWCNWCWSLDIWWCMVTMDSLFWEKHMSEKWPNMLRPRNEMSSDNFTRTGGSKRHRTTGEGKKRRFKFCSYFPYHHQSEKHNGTLWIRIEKLCLKHVKNSGYPVSKVCILKTQRTTGFL